MELKHQQLPYWVLSDVHQALRRLEGEAMKNLNPEWVKRFENATKE